MEIVTPAVRGSDLIVAGQHDRQLRRRAQRGELVRLAPGSYIDVRAWDALDHRRRYAAQIHAVVSRLARPVAISHWSAAAIHGLPHADGWPSRVLVTDSRLTKTAATPTLLRRAAALTSVDVEPWQGLWVTTAARTAADIALTEPFEHAVVVFDQGLRVAAFTRDQVRAHLLARPEARRLPSALRALDFASDKAEYAGESFSRCSMASRGFAVPVLQESFADAQGFIGCVDFWFPEVGVVGEFDGDWKYTDPRWLRGRTPAQAIIDEKRRQNRLDAHPRVRRVVRWDYAVAKSPDELARRLLAAGVPRLSATNRTARRA